MWRSSSSSSHRKCCPTTTTTTTQVWMAGRVHRVVPWNRRRSGARRIRMGWWRRMRKVSGIHSVYTSVPTSATHPHSTSIHSISTRRWPSHHHHHRASHRGPGCGWCARKRKSRWICPERCTRHHGGYPKGIQRGAGGGGLWWLEMRWRGWMWEEVGGVLMWLLWLLVGCWCGVNGVLPSGIKGRGVLVGRKHHR